MDYEKKYKEALKDMRAIYPNLKGDAKLAVEHAFPELRESEDERMINELQGFLCSFGSDYFGNGEWQKFDDWLEKQKDQKHLSTEETELNSIAFLEQLGYTCVPPGAEQKPAEWSEDDEKIMQTMIKDGDLKPSETAWLKSLPERFNLQPKQEWSEEDENNLELVIDCIYKFYPDPVMKYKLKEWLKSLRPSKDCSSCAKHLEGYISGRSDAENKLLEQFGALITPEDELHIKPRWKPSEEQMEALSDAYVEASTFKKGDILESLYNDLKKL